MKKVFIGIAILFGAWCCGACTPATPPTGGEQEGNPYEELTKNTIVENYQYAPEAPRSAYYSVSVAGQDCYVFPMITNHDKPHVVTFGANGLVRVEVVPNLVMPETVVVRPLVKEYPHWIEDGKIVLYLKEGDKATVEINGDEKMPLFIFVNPLETNKPSKDDPNVVYCEAGKIYDRQPTYYVTSGQTLYIEGGAIVKGGFRPEKQDNITIAGYGIMDDFHVLPENNSKWACRMDRCNGAKVSGVVIANMAGYSCATIMSTDIVFDDVKIIASWNEDNPTGVENGGIAFFACQRVKCSNMYSYAHDDTYMVKTNKWSWKGEAKDLVFENCQAFNAKGGNAFEIGYEVNEGVDGVTFRDCYVLHSSKTEGYTYRHAAFSIHNGTAGTVKNVHYENLYIDDPKEFCLYLSCLHDTGYSLGDGIEWGPGKIENVSFKNVHVYKKAPYGDVIVGYDADHTVKNVSFEDYYIEGKKITSFEEAGFHVDAAHPKAVLVEKSEVTFK